MPTTGKRFLAGRRILEVFWLGYRLPRLDETAQRQLVQEIVTLLREGIIATSAAHACSFDEIGTAVTQAEAPGRQGKIFLVPQKHEILLERRRRRFQR